MTIWPAKNTPAGSEHGTLSLAGRPSKKRLVGSRHSPTSGGIPPRPALSRSAAGSSPSDVWRMSRRHVPRVSTRVPQLRRRHPALRHASAAVQTAGGAVSLRTGGSQSSELFRVRLHRHLLEDANVIQSTQRVLKLFQTRSSGRSWPAPPPATPSVLPRRWPPSPIRGE